MLGTSDRMVLSPENFLWSIGGLDVKARAESKGGGYSPFICGILHVFKAQRQAAARAGWSGSLWRLEPSEPRRGSGARAGAADGGGTGARRWQVWRRPEVSLGERPFASLGVSEESALVLVLILSVGISVEPV